MDRKKSGKRRLGREAAVQFLYSHELHPETTLEEKTESFWDITINTKPEIRVFADQLAKGVMEHRESIDGHIEKTVSNYDLDRLSGVDRNIIRLAVYELQHLDTPAPVAINEAIEIARKFGTEESFRFVNGVLDQIRKMFENGKDTEVSTP